MALGLRDKSALLTYPQLLRAIDVNWKTYFDDLSVLKSSREDRR